MKSLLASLRGSDASRARVLARRVTRPKFALGQVVKDPYDELGVIDAIYADLEAAEDAGVVNDRHEWLRVQEIRPKTKPTEPWYSVILGEGNILCGERDLRRVAAKRG